MKLTTFVIVVFYNLIIFELATSAAIQRSKSRKSKSRNGDGCIKNFCERYRKEYVVDTMSVQNMKKLLRQNGRFLKAFNGSAINTYNEDLVQSRSPFSADTNMCDTTRYTILPAEARNKEGKWKLIMQSDNFKQTVTMLVCRNANSQCTLSDTFPDGYVSKCRQQMVDVKLLTVGSNGKSLKTDVFSVPSGCSCHYGHM